MEAGVFPAVRTRTALLATAALFASKLALATESVPTKSECIAASESGQDLRHAGKLRDARAQLAICVAASCPGVVRDDCADRLNEIKKAMASIVFDVTDSGGNDVPGLTITMDGRPIAGSGSADTNEVEVDPGEHTFTFEAAGLKKVEERLVIVEGTKRRPHVVIMDRATSAPNPNTEAPVSGDRLRRSAGPPTLSWVAFGVGGAGLAFGAIAGLAAVGKHSMLEDGCNNSASTCTPAYEKDVDAFHTWTTVSTVGYVVGALGVASGAVLWVTAPKERNAAATGVWLGPASAGMTGRF